MRRKFHGGIRPKENKSNSARNFIRDYFIPEQIILPTNLSSNNIVKLNCKVGDKVSKGQLLLAPEDNLNMAVHASTSGLVNDIKPHIQNHASGLTQTSIIIETDGNDTWGDSMAPIHQQPISIDDFLERVHISGIVGLGGAGFPTYTKLKLALQNGLETLLINGAECEPCISADDILMQYHARELYEGIQLLQQILKPKRTILGIEDNKPAAISRLKKTINDKDIKIDELPTLYPTGGEKQLIKLTTGIEVSEKEFAINKGVLCLNVATVVAIADYFLQGKPCISRIVTLAGQGVIRPFNQKVLIGTPIKELLAHAGIEIESGARVIHGGPMMGHMLQSLNAPVGKITNCLLLEQLDESRTIENTWACIRCGECEQACPSNLLPQELHRLIRAKELTKLEDFSINSCIECGACDYVCPSNIPLAFQFRHAKKLLKRQTQESEKSEYSRQRFEAKQDRELRIKDERDRKREAASSAKKVRVKELIQEAILRKAKESKKEIKPITDI